MKKLWGSFIASLKAFFATKPKSKKKLSKKKKAIIILSVVLSVIILLLFAVAIYMDSMLGLINRTPDNETLSSSEYEQWLGNQTETRPAGYEAIDPDKIDWNDDGDAIKVESGIVNILLIGQDRREGEYRARSDAMILCTINKNTKTLTLTSLMRDMYVQIPGYQDNRINTCYVFGGFELLNECIMTNFGIPIHGNIEVDFDGCMAAIDVLGGVDIELTAAEANHLNLCNNCIPTNEPWYLQPGMNHLTGRQAVSYARIRYLDSDFGRTERQRKVLLSLLNSCKNLRLTEIHGIFRQILPSITTDMTNSELLAHIWTVFNMLSDLKVENTRIPADDTYQNVWIRGMAVLLPDLEANRAILEQIVSPK